MKTWKKWILAAGILGMAAVTVSCGGMEKAGNGGQEKGKLKIGVVQIMQHASLDLANKGFIDGLKERGYDESKVVFDQQNAQGDQSNLRSITARFKNEKPALICAIATPSAQAVANEIKDIPIVATAVTDFVSAKLVKSNEEPGGNVTGVSDLTPVHAQLDLGRKLVHGAKRVGLIYCSSEVNSEIQAAMVKAYCRDNQLEVVERTVNSVNDIQQVAESLVGACDFIYVPTDNVIASSVPTLVKVTDAAKIPVIAGAGSMAKDGALAALSVDYYTLGKRTAYLAADILDGKVKPENTKIGYQTEYTLIINEKSRETLGLQIPGDIMKSAEKI